MEESGDVARAAETVEAQSEAETAALAEKVDPLTETLAAISIKPKKTDINVQLVSLAWTPHWQDEQGSLTPAW